MIQPVLNRVDLLTAVARTRLTSVKHVTNWFATADRIDYWIGCNSLFTLPCKHALLILRRDQGFHRVYHLAADLSALSIALQSTNGEVSAMGILTTDLIGHSPDVDPVSQIYRENSFTEHACLRRMILLPGSVAPSDSVEELAEVAGISDTTAVAAFLQTLLDPYRDAIPTQAEIREAAQGGNLLLTWSGKFLAGILWFEIKGISSHLRYWYVRECFRNQGIGARLIRQFLRLCAHCRRVIVWVASGNTDAIAKYSYYGFRPDPLLDRIMVRS